MEKIMARHSPVKNKKRTGTKKGQRKDAQRTGTIILEDSWLYNKANTLLEKKRSPLSLSFVSFLCPFFVPVLFLSLYFKLASLIGLNE